MGRCGRGSSKGFGAAAGEEAIIWGLTSVGANGIFTGETEEVEEK